MNNNNTNKYVPDVLKYDNNMKRVTYTYPMETFAGEDMNESDTDRNSVVTGLEEQPQLDSFQNMHNGDDPPAISPAEPPLTPSSSEAELGAIRPLSSIQFYSTYLPIEPPPQEPPTMLLTSSQHANTIVVDPQSHSFYSTYLTPDNMPLPPPPPPLLSTQRPPLDTPHLPPAQLLMPPQIIPAPQTGLSETLYSTSLTNLTEPQHTQVQHLLDNQDRIRQTTGYDNDAYLQPEDITLYLDDSNNPNVHTYGNLMNKYQHGHLVSESTYVNL